MKRTVQICTLRHQNSLILVWNNLSAPFQILTKFNTPSIVLALIADTRLSYLNEVLIRSISRSRIVWIFRVWTPKSILPLLLSGKIIIIRIRIFISKMTPSLFPSEIQLLLFLFLNLILHLNHLKLYNFIIVRLLQALFPSFFLSRGFLFSQLSPILSFFILICGLISLLLNYL